MHALLTGFIQLVLGVYARLKGVRAYKNKARLSSRQSDFIRFMTVCHFSGAWGSEIIS